MIKYTLKCSRGHIFESWFQSADAFDELRSRNLTSCIECGDTQIEKALMAPCVRTKAPVQSSDLAVAKESGPALHISPEEQAIAKMRAHIEANSDNVGKDFAKTARDIYHGHAPARAIHGTADGAQARALIEDGVPILPLPFGPKSKAN